MICYKWQILYLIVFNLSKKCLFWSMQNICLMLKNLMFLLLFELILYQIYFYFCFYSILHNINQLK